MVANLYARAAAECGMVDSSSTSLELTGRQVLPAHERPCHGRPLFEEGVGLGGFGQVLVLSKGQAEQGASHQRVSRVDQGIRHLGVG